MVLIILMNQKILHSIDTTMKVEIMKSGTELIFEVRVLAVLNNFFPTQFTVGQVRYQEMLLL